MEEITLSPHAASISQSLRDLGYSLETAIADLIDNSISAKADSINIFVKADDAEHLALAIIDNGQGMTSNQVLEAMRPGSRDPREKRAANDLGRFGMGLKTASFSQCRCFTVVTRKTGKLSAAQWDLDLIALRKEWKLGVLSESDIKDLPFIEQLGKQGTYVLWQKLDRLTEINSGNFNNKIVYDKLSDVEKHLALVFHRYLVAEAPHRKIKIEINGHPIEGFDPFFTKHSATQILPEEIMRIKGHEVRIQPYILPHHSKLSQKERDFYLSRGDFLSNQGAYIYRNRRLMAWGDWFKQISKSESTKLARVRIDFPNALDEEWTIDIKKSRAHPPRQIREKMRQIIDRIAERSTKVWTGRGDRALDTQEYAFWERYKDRQGIRYAINREHPLIIAFQQQVGPHNQKSLVSLLGLIERAIPIETIHADYSSSPQRFDEKEEISQANLKEMLAELHRLLSTPNTMGKQSFTQIVIRHKPFADYRDITLMLIEELFE